MSRSREVILQESNPEILRFYINELFKHNDQLSKTLTKAIEEKAKAAQKSFSLEDQLLILKKKFFGKSSEKRKIEDRVRDTEDQDLLVHSYFLVPPASRKNTKSLDEDPEALRRMGLHLLDEIATLNKTLNEVRAERDQKELAKQQWLITI